MALKTHFATALTGAFAFVTALTWNEFIKEILAQIITYFGLDGGLIVKLIGAILITILCAGGIYLFGKLKE